MQNDYVIKGCDKAQKLKNLRFKPRFSEYIPRLFLFLLISATLICMLSSHLKLGIQAIVITCLFSISVLWNTLHAEPDNHELETAIAVFEQWISYYQASDYRAQWKLNDPRNRRYIGEKSWRVAVRKSARKLGQIMALKLVAADFISAEDLPCTEMKHCYRRKVEYIALIIDASYEHLDGSQRELAVMSKSHEGWRVGGGSVLQRPLGESMVVLNHQDEQFYKLKFDN